MNWHRLSGLIPSQGVGGSSRHDSSSSQRGRRNPCLTLQIFGEQDILLDLYLAGVVVQLTADVALSARSTVCF